MWNMTEAERLLSLANAIRARRGELILCDSPIESYRPERIVLALKFESLGNAKVIRAIVEEWDIARIIREVY